MKPTLRKKSLSKICFTLIFLSQSLLLMAQADDNLINTPLSVTSLKATQQDKNRIDLQWTTAAESKTDHFIIERSEDGTRFEEIGTVRAWGNSTTAKKYVYKDDIAGTQSGALYYRLGALDTDGKTQYAKTTTVSINKPKESITSLPHWPNPFNSDLNISIPETWQKKQVLFEIVSQSGQLVSKSTIAFSNPVEILNLRTLSPGLYFLNARCGIETAQEKILKQ